MGAKRYHLGFRGKVVRSTLADANELRGWRIFANFAHNLIDVARPLYDADSIGLDLDQSLYALDSTTIDLYGSRLYRLRVAIPLHALAGLLRCARQNERTAPASLLAFRGQEHQYELGSGRCSDNHRIGFGILGCIAPRELIRSEPCHAPTAGRVHATGTEERGN